MPVPIPLTSATDVATSFETQNLHFSYPNGDKIIRDVNLSVRSGESVGIIGPNGAGKSTLLHLMIGLLSPDKGEANLGNENATAMEPLARARRVAFVPQSARVNFPYTVAEIVAMGRHPHLGIFSELDSEGRDKIAWAMEATGTTELSKRLFSQLSGGEAQRVILARALAQDAPALVLDEPTASLDLRHQSLLYGLLEELNKTRGMTLVVVTHDVNLAAEYCPRLIGLREGRILLDGPPDQVVTAQGMQKLYGVEADILRDGESRWARVKRNRIA